MKVDPNEGWKYGFPKDVPLDELVSLGNDVVYKYGYPSFKRLEYLRFLGNNESIAKYNALLLRERYRKFLEEVTYWDSKFRSLSIDSELREQGEIQFMDDGVLLFITNDSMPKGQYIQEEIKLERLTNPNNHLSRKWWDKLTENNKLKLCIKTYPGRFPESLNIEEIIQLWKESLPKTD